MNKKLFLIYAVSSAIAIAFFLTMNLLLTPDGHPTSQLDTDIPTVMVVCPGGCDTDQ